MFGSLPASADDDPQTGVQALMTKRMAAVTSGDKAAFMATVDPKATPAFRQAQSTTFDGIHSVPLSKYALSVRLTDSGDLAAGIDLAKQHNADRAYLPETRQSFRIGNYDDRDALDSLWLTYVERNGVWYVAGQDELSTLGLTSDVELWDFGPVAIQQTPHFIVLSEPGDTIRSQALASIGEDAIAIFNSQWKLPWNDKIPMVLPQTTEQASKILKTVANIDNFSAFVTFQPVRDDGWATTAPRLFAQDSNLAKESRSLQVQNMVHELAHAASAGLSGPYTPTWAHEGLAEYERLGQSPDILPPSGHAQTFPMDDGFRLADQGQVGRAYAEASSAMSYAASLKGTQAPVSLFSSIGSRRVVPGSPSYNVNAGVQEAMGISLKDFEAGWASRK